MYLDVFFILCIVSYGVGVSGFFRKFKKPFSCETCMAFWSSLLYIICTGNFNLKAIALCCLCSFLATPFANLLLTIREILNHILYKINSILS